MNRIIRKYCKRDLVYPKSLVPWLLIVIMALGCKENETQKLTVAAAANTQFAIREIISRFTEETGLECELVLGSSGKLTAQIAEGAPFDIFLAANMKYPEYLFNQGLAAKKPEIYAYGHLVIWTADPSLDLNMDLILDPSVGNIAVANPQTAPYGEAALQFLKNRHWLDSIDHKLVYGESISQTDQFIRTRSVTLGFTALSTVKSKHLSGIGKWKTVPQQAYDPIEQGVVLIKRGGVKNIAAEKFYTYLLSDEAAKILEDFGYSKYE